MQKIASALFGSQAVAFLTGAIFALLLPVAFPSFSLEKWQTLLAGYIALCGALLTVKTIEKQIQQAKESEKQNRERRAIVLKAQMLLALGNILDNIRSRLLYAHNQQGDVPQIPESLQIFINSLEFVDKESLSQIKEMVRKYQIYQARLETYDARSASQRVERIMESLKLGWRVLSFFSYARDEVRVIEEPLFNRWNIESSLLQVLGAENYSQNDYSEIDGIIARHFRERDNRPLVP